MEGRKKRVLLIEDDEAITEALRYWLVEAGWEVECVGDGKEGLEKMAGGKWDVVLLDVMLPSVQGEDVWELSKFTEGGRKKIVAMTALPKRDLERRGMDLQDLPTLCKPFTIEDLERVLEDVG